MPATTLLRELLATGKAAGKPLNRGRRSGFSPTIALRLVGLKPDLQQGAYCQANVGTSFGTGTERR